MKLKFEYDPYGKIWQGFRYCNLNYHILRDFGFLYIDTYKCSHTKMTWIGVWKFYIKIIWKV